MTRVALFGLAVDAISMDEALRRILATMRGRRRMCHAALNVAKLVRMRADPDLHADVRASDMVTADGMGIVLAARLTGQPLPERVTGVDLMERTLALCARHGFRPYLLGARQDVLEAAIYRLRLRHPGLVIAGYRNGYFQPDDEADIIAEINASRADCLFVGVPTPMKERFLARNRAALTPAFTMGVGGSIDVAAGLVRRAPRWMQQAGLEWIFRLTQEPRRMWRRYLVTNSRFALWLITALAYRAAGQRFSPLDQAPGRGTP